MKTDYRYLPYLHDLTSPCITREYKKLGIKVGETMYITYVPNDADITIVHNFKEIDGNQ